MASVFMTMPIYDATPAPAHLLEGHLPHVHLSAQRQQNRMLAVRVCAAHAVFVG